MDPAKINLWVVKGSTLLHQNCQEPLNSQPGGTLDAMLKQFNELFVCFNEPGTLRLFNHTKGEHRFWDSFCKSLVRLGHHDGYTALPKWEISVQCLSQGYNDALPERESNQRSATLRSLARYSTTELSNLFRVFIASLQLF